MRALVLALVLLPLAGCLDGHTGLVALGPESDSGRIVVKATTASADWSQLKITASEPVLRWLINGEATTAASGGAIQQSGAFAPLSASSKPVEITDFVDLCFTRRSAEFSAGPTVRILDGQREILSWPFHGLDAC